MPAPAKRGLKPVVWISGLIVVALVVLALGFPLIAPWFY